MIYFLMYYIIKKTLYYKILISIPLSFILSFLYWKHIQFSIIFTILREIISTFTYCIFEKIYNKYNNIKYLKNKENENVKFHLYCDDDYNDYYDYEYNNYNTF